MRIRRMQEIDLSPFQRTPRPSTRVLRLGLRPPHMPREDNIVLWLAVAAVASQGARNYCRRSHNAGKWDTHLEGEDGRWLCDAMRDSRVGGMGVQQPGFLYHRYLAH
jgi:hypothetical protein